MKVNKTEYCLKYTYSSLYNFLFTCLLFFYASITYSQKAENEPVNMKIERFSKSTIKKSVAFEKRIINRTDKSIKRYIKQEKKLKKQLSKIDSEAANVIFDNSIDSLLCLKKQLFEKKLNFTKPLENSRKYIPLLDTIKGAIKFLKLDSLENNFLVNKVSKISEVQDKLDGLESKLACSEQYSRYIKERKTQLEYLLSKYKGKLNYDGVLKKWSKEYYYYSETIKNFEGVFNDPTKAQKELLAFLNHNPAFKDYIQKYGGLADIFFRSDPTNFEGLQTKAMVEQALSKKMGMFGKEGSEIILQKIALAQQTILKAASKYPALNNASEIPEFKPNSQRTKTFLERFEYGFDLQADRSSKLVPSSFTFGLSVGYKLNDKFITGLGTNFTLFYNTKPFKTNINKEDLGLRYYLEYAIGKGFNLRGGWERKLAYELAEGKSENIQPFFRDSALLGFSKTIAFSAKQSVIKKQFKGRAILMYDFLAERHIPATAPIVFRIELSK